MSKSFCCYLCFKMTQTICEDCGKAVCNQHGSRDKHPCDDSVKGAHGMIGGR